MSHTIEWPCDCPCDDISGNIHEWITATLTETDKED